MKEKYDKTSNCLLYFFFFSEINFEIQYAFNPTSYYRNCFFLFDLEMKYVLFLPLF